jgi:hypothetical protein
MRRKLFNLAATASLVLGVAIAALWVRSYFVYDYLTRSQKTGLDFWSDWGQMGVLVIDWGDQLKHPDSGFRYYHPFPPVHDSHQCQML